MKKVMRIFKRGKKAKTVYGDNDLLEDLFKEDVIDEPKQGDKRKRGEQHDEPEEVDGPIEGEEAEEVEEPQEEDAGNEEEEPKKGDDSKRKKEDKPKEENEPKEVDEPKEGDEPKVDDPKEVDGPKEGEEREEDDHKEGAKPKVDKPKEEEERKEDEIGAAASSNQKLAKSDTDTFVQILRERIRRLTQKPTSGKYLSNWRKKRMLSNTYFVVVFIHIGKQMRMNNYDMVRVPEENAHELAIADGCIPGYFHGQKFDRRIRHFGAPCLLMAVDKDKAAIRKSKKDGRYHFFNNVHNAVVDSILGYAKEYFRDAE